MKILASKVVLPIASAPIINGALVLDGARIHDIGPVDEIRQKFPDVFYCDFGHTCLMPGLVNAHTHLDLTAFPRDYFTANFEDEFGMPRCRSGFVDWVGGVISYRKSVVQQTFADAIEEGAQASIRSGTTCVGEIATLEGEAAILKKAGLRSVIFPEIISYNAEQAQDLFEVATALVEKNMDLVSSEDPEHPLLQVGLSPHAPYTVSRPLLKILMEFSRQSNCRVQIHAAESFQEMEFFFDAAGEIAEKLFPLVGWGELKPPCVRKTPIEYLDSINFLDCAPTLIHCVQVSDADLDRIAQSKSQVVLCPRSNAYLNVGKAPYDRFLAHEIPLGLGTDSLASNTSLSLWDEMRYFWHATRKEKNKAVLSAEKILKMATLGSAEVLGLKEKIGSFQRQKFADLINVRIPSLPKNGDLKSLGDDFFESLITRTQDSDIQMVMVNGRVLHGAIPQPL